MSTPGNREVAHRLFAAEFDDSEYSYSESDEERAPNYVVTPTGARVNRLFAVGVLTEVSQAGESILRARVVDPTGAFVVYAGQYQPEAMAFLEGAQTPTFVAVTGKARTFQPDDGDQVYTSVRPESISEVDADTRDRWTIATAERTLDRLGTIAAALESGFSGENLRAVLAESGVDPSLAAGVPIALREYGTTSDYLDALQSLALDCVRLVAGDTDEVAGLDVAPDAGAGTEPFTPARRVELHATGMETAATAAEPTSPSTGEGETTGSAPDETASPTEPPAETTSPSTDAPESDTESVEEPPESTEEPVESPAEESAADSQSPQDAATASDTPDSSTPASEEPAVQMDEGDGTDVTEEPGLDDEAVATEEFDLDDDVRQEVEDEFGVEFETAAEVSPAGEADIEPEEPEPSVEPAASSQDEGDEPSFDTVEPDPEAPEPSFEPTDDDEPASPASDEPATAEPTPPDDERDDSVDSTTDETEAEEPVADTDVSIDDVLLETMRELDEGDGAPADELVSRVASDTGEGEDAVEDAIQEALMSGQCYEPEDGYYKPI